MYKTHYQGNGIEVFTLLGAGFSLWILRFSIVLNMKSLLFVVKMETSSEDEENLQHKICSRMVVSLLLTIFMSLLMS